MYIYNYIYIIFNGIIMSSIDHFMVHRKSMAFQQQLLVDPGGDRAQTQLRALWDGALPSDVG